MAGLAPLLESPHADAQELGDLALLEEGLESYGAVWAHVRSLWKERDEQIAAPGAMSRFVA